jgi:hypothetical protein
MMARNLIRQRSSLAEIFARRKDGAITVIQVTRDAVDGTTAPPEFWTVAHGGPQSAKMQPAKSWLSVVFDRHLFGNELAPIGFNMCCHMGGDYVMVLPVLRRKSEV